MVTENYACAYKEVIEILKYTKREDVNKIPKHRILLMKYNMNKEHNFKVDETKPIEQQNIMEETKAILASIFKKYWATEYQKERIEAKQKYDMELIEQEKKEKYNPDNIFKKTTQNFENKEETALVEIKEYSWKNKIVKFFNSILEKIKLK